MTNANRPALNLDLLRTFVAVANLNTFAAAAASVCRTQSAVRQQMQRLEQLVGKEFFARHGRNKLLTEHGIQLLGYARKILLYNDEACTSLMFSNIQDVLTIGASGDTADTILPYLLNRVTRIYPKLSVDVCVKRGLQMVEMLNNGEVNLAISTQSDRYAFTHPSVTLRTSPTLWYCSADYRFTPGEIVPLMVLDEPSPFRTLAVESLDAAGVPWPYRLHCIDPIRRARGRQGGYGHHPAAGRDDEPRTVGTGGKRRPAAELPATRYALCKNPQGENKLAMAIFNALQSGSDTYTPKHRPRRWKGKGKGKVLRLKMNDAF